MPVKGSMEPRNCGRGIKLYSIQNEPPHQNFKTHEKIYTEKYHNGNKPSECEFIQDEMI